MRDYHPSQKKHAQRQTADRGESLQWVDPKFLSSVNGLLSWKWQKNFLCGFPNKAPEQQNPKTLTNPMLKVFLLIKYT